MNILITGAAGQLGLTIRDVAAHSSKHSFCFRDNELDISNYSELGLFFRQNKTDCVINCAAYTAVDKAESESGEALRINHLAVQNLVDLAAIYKFRLIHISTDYVFDGTKSAPYVESDIPKPLSVYGTSKLLGETAILNSDIDGCIIRTSWLYSKYGNNFVKTILNALKLGKTLNVVNDQRGSPTWALDLASFILKSIIEIPRNKSLPIIHYCDMGDTTWFDLALAVSEFSGIPGVIQPVSSDNYPQVAKRPHFSLLDTAKVMRHYGITIPHWRTSLELCINELMQNG